MALYQVILAYDGTNFLGFQRQGRARTVQGEVETALRRLNWQGSSILAAGRTDTGVHASGQVIAFELDWNHTYQELVKALNANLPEDVAVQSVSEAEPGFHPRFNAVARLYRYQLYFQPERDPLRDRYAWRVYPPVDLDRLQSAARLLPGIHDCAAFGTPPRAGGSTIRMVYRADWQPKPGGLQFEICANAFLYHMVRRIVFLLVLVGQGRLSLEKWEQGIRTAQPQTPGLAPPNGLVLAEVKFGNRQEYMDESTA